MSKRLRLPLGKIGLMMALGGLVACQTQDTVSRSSLVSEELASRVSTPDQCRPIAEAQLTALGIAEADVESLQHFRDTYRISNGFGDDMRRLRGVDSWANLTTCEGYIVIEHAPDCAVERVWTRGNCTIPSAG